MVTAPERVHRARTARNGRYHTPRMPAVGSVVPGRPAAEPGCIMPPHDIDCLVLGTSGVDVVVRPVDLARPIGGGRLVHVEPLDLTTGGIVCNSGIALRTLGLEVAAAGLVGDDLWGRIVRERLADAGIDVVGIEPHPTEATRSSAVLVDPGGERSFAHHVGAPRATDMAFVRRQLPLFARARMALIGYVGLMPRLGGDLAAAVAAIRGTGCGVALETSDDGGPLAELAAALPLVDCFVPSLAEAAQQTGMSDPRAIIDCYRGHGAKGIVGVKLGTLGVLLSHGEGFEHIPCLPAPGPIVDTTGAGDAFLAGLLAGRHRGMSLRAAGLLGAATAACCVTGLGGTAGLRSFAETWRLATAEA